MTTETIPAPAYVRYQGPGDFYLVRYTVGPYRVMAEVGRHQVVAVPTYLVPLLVDADQGSWERVDDDEALLEIVEQDRRLAAEEAEWQAHQQRIAAAKAEQTALLEINAAKAATVRTAALEAKRQGLARLEVIAAAADAEHTFELGLAELAELPDHDRAELAGAREQDG